MRPCYILSPCGTSILTNQAADNEERRTLFRHANARAPREIPEPDRQRLAALVERVTEFVDQANEKSAAKMSAELNGIIRFYDGVIPARHDFHLLLSTDTWLGSVTTELVKRWLDRAGDGLTVVIHRQTDLQTRDLAAFQLALSELLRRFDEEITRYSQQNYRVIFNLTGGFKSIQGFLQSIANFYADETVYIFETASELMRIPRLPVRLDAAGTIRENLAVLRRLRLGLPPASTDLVDIPETMLLRIEDETALSPWGELLCLNHIPAIYQERLWPPPDSDKIRYSKKFTKKANELPPERTAMLNRRIDDLTRHLGDQSYNPRSLDFKPLKGRPRDPSTHELDAWADLDARRIFGHFEEAVFVIDDLDRGLH
jgi:putative CRISPR-associated protein (TIGR02619 family)